MARIEFDIRTDAPPEAIRAALLDFSGRRPEMWPGLPPDQYEVYEIGDTWAEIREGYRGRIWVRERYDWSVEGPVRFTVVDSGFAKPGSYVVVDIQPADGAGSMLHITLGTVGQGPVRHAVRRPDGANPGRRHPPLIRSRPRPDRSRPGLRNEAVGSNRPIGTAMNAARRRRNRTMYVNQRMGGGAAARER